MKLQINNKRYPFVFNINAIKTFSRYKKFEKINQFDKFIATFTKSLGTKKANEQLTFEQLDDINNLFYSAIKEGCRKESVEFDLDTEDLLDHITSNSESFSQMMEGFMEEVPKQGN